MSSIRPLFARFRTPLYKNTGSVARDHLASERTFLAWLRTGLGFIALGIAIERFSQLDLSELLPPKPDSKRHSPKGFKETSDMLVGALLGTGTGSIVYGSTRYFQMMKLLEQGYYKPAYWGAAGLGVSVAGLAGIVYWSAVGHRWRQQEEEAEEGKH